MKCLKEIFSNFSKEKKRKYKKINILYEEGNNYYNLNHIICHECLKELNKFDLSVDIHKDYKTIMCKICKTNHKIKLENDTFESCIFF